MEGLTRLVSESLARHGFDHSLDYRRLHWSRWFRCESHHSLLFVPSKPGVFALAEEITDLALGKARVGADARVRPSERSSDASPVWDRVSDPVRPSTARQDPSGRILDEILDRRSHVEERRMLAVTHFYEDDDMAFVLDRMLSHKNPLRDRLASGRYFVRFVVIEDRSQRMSICSALNQWMVSAAEKASGIGSHFASSLELTPATEYVPAANDAPSSLFHDANLRQNCLGQPNVGRAPVSAATEGASNSVAADAAEPASSSVTAPQLDSGAATNIHCPSPFPSGF